MAPASRSPRSTRVGRQLALLAALLLWVSACGKDATVEDPTGGAVDTVVAVADAVADAADVAAEVVQDVIVDVAADAASDTVEPDDAEQDATAGCGACSGDTPHCDLPSATCVACVSANHCAKAGSRCIDHVCTDPLPCKSDKTCTVTSGVCDVAAEICVDCLADADCAQGMRCAAHICVPKGLDCASSKDCKDGAQVCDKALQLCVDCTSDDDCAANRYCADGLCLVDVCVAGDSTCVNQQSRTSCAANGAKLTTVDCGDSSACKGGVCLAKICTPAAKRCTGADAETCDSLGVAWTVSATCDATEACAEGACVKLVCKPGETKCAGAAVLQCDKDGLNWVATACGDGKDGKAVEVCADGDGSTGSVAACKAQICTPGASLCDGSVVQTCSANGLALVDGEDCAQKAGSDAGYVCEAGSCVALSCKPGATSCANTAVLTCKPDGKGYDTNACGADQGCALGACKAQVCTPKQLFCVGKELRSCDSGGVLSTLSKDCSAEGKTCSEGACVPMICQPGAKTCAASSAGLDVCAPDGLSTSAQVCPLGEVCIADACAKVICQVDEVFCLDAKTPATCEAKGTKATAKPACAADETCQAGSCLKAICKPGAVQCAGIGKQQTCNAAGVAWIDTDCPLASACDGGICKQQSCNPGTTACKGSEVWTCDAKGLQQTVTSDCAKTGDVCKAGICEKPICKAGEKACINSKPSTCAADGLSWSDSACKSGEACVDGGCLAVVCTPGAKTCDAAKVMVCNASGTASDLGADCAKASQVCSAGACKSTVCTAGAKTCQGDKLATCAADGLSVSVADCPSGQICEADACKPVICTANTTLCNGNDVQTCNAKGTASSKTKTCPSGETCSSGACKSTVCTAGAKTCQGDKLATCSADGLTLDVANCPSGQICEADACKPVICAANTTLCNGNDVQTCNAKGTASTKTKTCPSGETCSQGACIKTLCTPKEVVCIGAGQVSTCAADGMSWSTSTCDAGSACYQGACYVQVCTPNEKLCKGTTASVCHPSGGNFVEVQKCGLTGEGCVNGACVKANCVFGAKSCNGSQVAVCNQDGTTYTLTPCDDGDACTENICSNGACSFGPTKACDDGNSCTKDSCDTKTGACVKTPASGSCDDGSKCTTGDTCTDGACLATPSGTVTTIAGSGTAGLQEGAASSATFSSPEGLTLAPDGTTVLIADFSNHRIRALGADGQVSTWAGTSGGLINGSAAGARFWYPVGLTTAPGGVVYVGDQNNHAIRAVVDDGKSRVVSTLAGNGSAGYVDGKGAIARFYNPQGLVFHPGAGALVVADLANRRLRMVALDGTVTTLAGSGGNGSVDGKGTSAMIAGAMDVAVDNKGLIWFTDANGHRVRTCGLDGTVTTVLGSGTAQDVDGALGVALTKYPYSVIAGPGSVFVGGPTSLRAIIGNNVATLAGSTTAGYADGNGSSVRFQNIRGMLRLSDGSVLIADTGNHRIRKLLPSFVECDDGAACTTDSCDAKTGACVYAPIAAGKPCSDGLQCTTGDVCDAKSVCAGKTTVCDDSNVCTDDACNPTSGKCEFTANTGECDDSDACTTFDRCENTACVAGWDTASTVAGSGASGSIDGVATSATFVSPRGIAVDSKGLIWVCDVATSMLRTIDAKGVVSTVNGGVPGFADGPLGKASFKQPSDIAVDAMDRLIIADTANARIRRIDAAGVVSTLAGLGTVGYVDGPANQARFSQPYAVAVQPSGVVVVSDLGNKRIRSIAVDGTVGTLAGNGSAGYADGAASSAKFGEVHGIAVAGSAIYLCDTSNARIRKLENGQVTTVAGSGVKGSQDGPGSSASFHTPTGIQIRADGLLVISDPGTARIRTINAQNEVATLLGSAGSGFVDGPAPSAKITTAMHLALLADGSWVFADATNRRIRRLAPSATFCEDGDACGVDTCDKAKGTCVHTVAKLGAACDDNNACTASSACAATGRCTGTPKDCDDKIACSIDLCDPIAGTCAHPTPFASCDDGDACTKGETCWEGSCGVVAQTSNVVAGTGISGGLDGKASEAQLAPSYGMAMDDAGMIYIGATSLHRIRSYDPNKQLVATFAGTNTVGMVDGPAEIARFNAPMGVAWRAGTVYVADSSNQRIRAIHAGKVSTLAGNSSAGYVDGPAWLARFSLPRDVAVDAFDSLAVADSNNYRVRGISAGGVVSTLAGAGISGYLDGPATTARFAQMYGLAYGKDGSIYVADIGNLRIRHIDTAGNVTTVAGNGGALWVDGVATSASLVGPSALQVLNDGSVLFVDKGGKGAGVRMLVGGKVSTLSGGDTFGSWAGASLDASWSSPFALAANSRSAIYVLDNTKFTIRALLGGAVPCDDGNPCTTDACSKASGSCVHTPLAGGASCNDGNACTSGDVCGAGGCAGKAKDCNDNDFCTDDVCAPYTGGCSHVHNIAPCDDGKLCTEGERCWQGSCHGLDGLVLPFVGYGTVAIDGVGGNAGFSGPTGIAVDSDKALWVADSAGHRLVRVTPDGTATTIVAGSGDIDGPVAYALTSTPRSVCTMNGQVFWFDFNNYRIRRLADGVVKTIAGAKVAGYVDGSGSDARFNGSFANSACDPAHARVVFGDGANYRIRAVSADGKVSTLAGTGVKGYADGAASSAQFGLLNAAAVAADGSIIVADFDNARLRKLATNGNVTTIAGSGGKGYVDGPASSAQFGNISALAIDDLGRLFVADIASPRVRYFDNGQVGTLAGNGKAVLVDGPASSAGFTSITGMTVLADGDLMVSEAGRQIRRVVTLKRLCADGKACTIGSCDDVTGCSQTARPDGQTCQDGDNACNLGSACASGSCKGGTVKDCQDKNECTTDACTGAAATCTHTPIAGCVPKIACGNGVKQTGEECDDGNEDPYDACDNNCKIPVPFAGSTILDASERSMLVGWMGGSSGGWKTCYVRSVDGAASATFHNNCDGKGPSVVFAKVASGERFGGYAGASWTSASAYTVAPQSFLFSLTEKTKLANIQSTYSFYGNSKYGPTFGGGHDWHVAADMTTGYSNLGHSYACSVAVYGSATCKGFLAGSEKSWSIVELEVWVQL